MPQLHFQELRVVENTRILVLEDDRNLLDALCDVLADEGYEVDACWRGEQAVDFARSNRYDLVVSDIRMEGLDGLGALSEVQSYLPDVGSLVVTGYATDVQTDRASRLSFNALLRKPFELDRFLKAVDEVLNTRKERLQQQLRLDSKLAHARWLTDWLVKLLDETDDVVDTARYLGGKLGLSGERIEEVCATILHRLGGSLQAPPTVTTLVSDRSTVESRIVELCYVAAKQPDKLEEEPSRFDPTCIALLDQRSDSEPEDSEQKSLLDVARAQMVAGDHVNAQHALQEVVNREAASPSGVEALLELARLKHFSGHQDESIRLAGRAAEVASHVGPLLAAETGLRSGLILSKMGEPSQAGHLFEAAIATFGELGLSHRKSQCSLALAHLRQTEPEAEHLEELANHQAHLLDSLEWLLPLLLKYPQKPELPRLLQQFPQACVAILSVLTPEERAHAIDSLRESESSAASYLRGALAESKSAPLSPEVKLSLRTLGRFELKNGANTLAENSWKTSKVKFLFCLLASARGPVSEDLILEQFWSGDLHRAKKNLQATVSYLRRALKSLLLDETTVVREGATLRLSDQLSLWHDVNALRDAVEAARRSRDKGDAEASQQSYGEVFQLYTGPYLESCYHDWAVALRTEVEDAALEASLSLAQSALDQQRFEQALEYSKTAAKVQPDLEEAVDLVMRACIALQRPTAAIREFEAHKRALAVEFDAVPSVELERLHLKAKMLL